MEAQYTVRLNQVLDFMDSSIHLPLELQDFANVANMSRFHFHRVFQQAFGVTAIKYLQRLRLEKAIRLLIYNPSFCIGEVSDRCGFSASSNFGRAFRSYYDISARDLRSYFDFRNIENFSAIARKHFKGHVLSTRIDLDIFEGYKLENIRKGLGEELFESLRSFSKVGFHRRDPASLVYCRHFGRLAIDRLEANAFGLWFWAGSLSERLPETHIYKIGITPDRPEFTEPDFRRHDIGVLIPEDIPCDAVYNRREIAGGLWATLPIVAPPQKHRFIWRMLMSQWLPKVPWEHDDRPVMTLFSFHNQKKATGCCEHLFCLPIRSTGQ